MSDSHLIIIIDRNRGFRDEVAVHLKKAGYRVVQAEERRDGLPLMFGTHPDLILLEMSFDLGNGWETLSRIRSLTDAPVFLMAECVNETDQQRAAAEGANKLLEKSIPWDDLAAHVRSQLKQIPRVAHDCRSKIKNVKPQTARGRVSLRFLTRSQLKQIDQALGAVGSHGEVWLIKQRGRLRTIARVKVEELGAAPA